ncbi:MAG: hypothetical protein J3K34DRAFT_448732 [Monoraphidium minutum]|nr:MAG: hypothetical protein J3K34DRAFT_448732 [Monoraphidium minutum]
MWRVWAAGGLLRGPPWFPKAPKMHACMHWLSPLLVHLHGSPPPLTVFAPCVSHASWPAPTRAPSEWKTQTAAGGSSQPAALPTCRPPARARLCGPTPALSLLSCQHRAAAGHATDFARPCLWLAQGGLRARRCVTNVSARQPRVCCRAAQLTKV